ncbi:hypothetical protein RJ639_046069 [Escallonia herrerae]|uniref:Ty3 transposon capsid-like protein domain-containing protein n=1 Tax=Escallonia herrerae TaxID=1293975 RepID=A0AA88W8E5_9ASTE|nr:hypothetical protein RJ639_046069 [Escallonia herrerae]
MRSELEALGEHLQRTVASQVELIFNRLDDLEVDSRLTVLEQKVDVFAEELDDLIEERVAHFTKWEVQTAQGPQGTSHGALRRTSCFRLTVLEQKVDVVAEELDDLIEDRVAHLTKWEVQPRKDLQGQVMKLQEELAASLDIDDEKEKVQTVVMYLNNTAALRWRRRYTDGCDVKTWEKFKHELKRQFYPKSIVDIAMINLKWLRKKGSIRKYVKEYSTFMLKIPEMSERQRLCFFIDGLQQWVATELRRREPHDLSSAMAIVERLGDFKQRERPRSARHDRAKDSGDSSHYGRYCLHNGKMIVFLNKHKGSKGYSSSSDGEARMGALQMVNAFLQKSREETAKKKRSLFYTTVDVAGKTQEVLVDTRATHNFMSPKVAEWLGLKPTKGGSWFTAVNAEERLTKGVVKNIDLRIDGWTGKANFNIINMDELRVVLGMDFMEKSSATLNPYCGVMMMVGKEGQPKWMIPLVSKDGANARKGITVLQLDEGLTLCYIEW